MSKTQIVRVAVTGHRLNQLPEAERPRIQADIARALERIDVAATQMTAGEARFVLISAIAEGADRYAADGALARSWRLVTPLPFDVARYEEDFAEAESKAHYQRLLWASHKVTSVSAAEAAAIGGRAANYAAVGRVLIAKADLLLCVWNGQPPKGPGGTAEVAALMLERGGMVLWIATERDAPRLIAPASAPRAGTLRRKLLDALAALYGHSDRPAEMRVA